MTETPNLTPLAKQYLDRLKKNIGDKSINSITHIQGVSDEDLPSVKEQLKRDSSAYPFHEISDKSYWDIKNRLNSGHFTDDARNICKFSNDYKKYPEQYNSAKEKYNYFVLKYGKEDKKTKNFKDNDLKNATKNMNAYRRGKNLLRGPFKDYPPDGQAAAISNSLAENPTFDPTRGETTNNTRLGSVGHGTAQWTYPTRVQELNEKTLNEQPWLLRQVNETNNFKPPLTRNDLKLEKTGTRWGYQKSRSEDVSKAYHHILSNSSEEANTDLMETEDTRAPIGSIKKYLIVSQDDKAVEITKEEISEGKEPFHHVREILQRDKKQLVKDFGKDPDTMSDQDILKLSRQIKAASYVYILENPIWAWWKAQARASGAECAQSLVDQWRDEIDAEQNGLPVARIGDAVLCPDPLHGMTTIIMGQETVTAEGKPKAHAGSATSCGAILMEEGCNPTVKVNGQSVARVGTRTSHGGVVIAGAGSVAVGNGNPSVSPDTQSKENLDIYYDQIIKGKENEKDIFSVNDVAEQFMEDHKIPFNEELRTDIGKTLIKGAREHYYQQYPDERPNKKSDE